MAVTAAVGGLLGQAATAATAAMAELQLLMVLAKQMAGAVVTEALVQTPALQVQVAAPAATEETLTATAMAPMR